MMVRFLNCVAEILEIFDAKYQNEKKYHSKFKPLIQPINFDFVRKIQD